MGRHHSPSRKRLAVIASLGFLIGGPAAVVPSTAGWADDAIVDYTATPQDDPRVTVDSDATRASDAFAINGTLLTPEGDPVANTELNVSLDPGPSMLVASETDENAAIAIQLGGTHTDARGNFSVHLPALKNVDQYLDVDGNATLMFMNFDGTSQMMFRQYVRLPKGAGSTPIAALPDKFTFGPFQVRPQRDPNITPEPVPVDQPPAAGPDGLDFTSPDSADEQTSMAPVEPVAHVNLIAEVSSADAAAAAAGLNIGKECTRAWGTVPWSNYKWTRTGNPVRVWVPVQRAQTGSKTTMSYDWSNSKQTYMETSIEYGYKGVGVRGGFSKAVTTSAGVGFNVGHDVVRDLEVEYDYYHYALSCQMSGNATVWRDTKVRELRPYAFKGFNRSTTYSGYYRCTSSRYRGTLGHALWVSRSATTELSVSGGLKGDKDGLSTGISVSAKQTNTKDYKKTYTPTGSGAKICGENGNPTVTERVLETS